MIIKNIILIIRKHFTYHLKTFYLSLNLCNKYDKQKFLSSDL